MIYVRITEGLGNQLYKYAFAYALARQYDRKLIIDTAGYKYDPRNFQLDQFQIKADIVCLAAPLKNNKIGRAAARAVRRFQMGLHYKYIEESSDTFYRFQALEKLPACPVYIQGYWQNYRYFQNFESELKEQFQLKHMSLELSNLCREIFAEESVAVHIRMGDYRIQDRLKLDYYFEALQYLLVRKNAKIYIFCEKKDLPTIKNNFDTYTPIYVAEKYADLSDIETFQMMKSCRHQIISNSTYSWWAAWLNEYEQKIVTAPLVDKLDADYYPPKWVLFPAEHM